jgi:hypothetical protein
VRAQVSPIVQTSTTEFYRSLAQNHVPLGTRLFSRVERRLLLRQFRERLLDTWCIWRDSFRSFRGHISTQLAIGQAVVHLGPSLRIDSLGQRHRNIRTVARRLYTERLLATLPWVDCQDRRIFLMGFDAGESFACKMDTERNKRNGNDPCWLTSEIEHEICDRLHAINSVISQT